MKKKVFLTLGIILPLISCSSDDTENQNGNLPPRQFDVIATKSGFNSITFRWTESTDPENSIVKYDIYIAENTEDAEFQLIAENLTEQQIADTNVININGGYIEIDPPENPEYRFAYVATDLDHNKQYKGKVVAKDEEGQSSESAFWSTTLMDDVPPVIDSFTQHSTYRFNAKLFFRVREKESRKFTWRLFLNGTLFYEEEAAFQGTSESIYLDLENLSEETSYDGEIIIVDGNGNESEPFNFSFATTGDVWVGDIEFATTDQEQIDFFDANQYRAIVGDVIINRVGFSKATSLVSIEEITGDLTLDFLGSQVQLFPDLQVLNGNLIMISVDPANYLDNLTVVNGDIRMFYTQHLNESNNLPVLENLIRVGDLELFEIQSQPSLLGFNNLSIIEGRLRIDNARGLSDIDFLANVTEIGNGVSIFFCEDLADFCGLETVVNANGVVGGFSITDCPYNPTFDDIANGACRQ